jgi:hypothetical protein
MKNRMSVKTRSAHKKATAKRGRRRTIKITGHDLLKRALVDVQPKIQRGLRAALAAAVEAGRQGSGAMGESKNWTCYICGTWNSHVLAACNHCRVPRAHSGSKTASGEAANWTCHICGALNSNVRAACSQCRVPRAHSGSKTASAEVVDHPAHYGGADDPYEAIKVIEAWALGFCLGNAVKYVCRAGRKNVDPLEDLKKARWYLDREITYLERNREASDG